MPSTYRAAPIPAAAVLSGAAVNAGVIGLLRFLPLGAGLTAWGDTLVALGMFGAFYGVAIGLTQRNPKALLAYSSVSQMGLIAATLGKGLVAANTVAAGATALYAAHHGLAKGGLFLATGIVMSGSSGRRAWTLPFIALLALSLAGLPPTGGMIAKLALKEPLGDGVLGVLSVLSAIASTMLMLRFLERLRATPRSHAETFTLGLIGPWLVVTAASIGVPTIYLFANTPAGLASLFDYRLVWESLWPVLAGAALAAASWRWLDRAPIVPEGDIAVLGQRAAGEFGFTGVFVERAERLLRSWPVAAAMLLAIATVLAGTGIQAR
jgi:formate hydrogenlyase subunit 3/multisubunit Na+/H+ antiporter MnhD subunit